MAALPPLLRPTLVIRRNALRKGLLGPSTFWKVVAVVVLGRGTLHKIFGKHTEHLGKRRIKPGHMIVIAASQPLTRKERKRSGLTKDVLRARAAADLDAAQRAS